MRKCPTSPAKSWPAPAIGRTSTGRRNSIGCWTNTWRGWHDGGARLSAADEALVRWAIAGQQRLQLAGLAGELVLQRAVVAAQPQPHRRELGVLHDGTLAVRVPVVQRD